ncbi:MAG: hypothetical protein IPQ07_33370 [Myxococcales bacterium]|nr:hypothetical protein [Myxococcales bacterium]
MRDKDARIGRVAGYAEFVGIDGRGVVTDKTSELRDSAAPAPGASPDFVIVDYQIWFRRTTLWPNRGGRWQCISFHSSRINDA